MSNYVESFGNRPKLAEKYGLFVNLEKIYNKNVEKNRMGGLDMNKINVAIADDNQRTVEMMTELLEQESDIEVIASADNGEDPWINREPAGDHYNEYDSRDRSSSSH